MTALKHHAFDLTERGIPIIRILECASPAPFPGQFAATCGSSMAVRDDGAVIGSLSGGCVEGRAFEACVDVLSGSASTILDEETCAGRLRSAMRMLDDYAEAAEQIRPAAAGRAAQLAFAVESETFLEEHPERARMILVGATHEAIALSGIASSAGCSVTV